MKQQQSSKLDTTEGSGSILLKEPRNHETTLCNNHIINAKLNSQGQNLQSMKQDSIISLKQEIKNRKLSQQGSGTFSRTYNQGVWQKRYRESQKKKIGFLEAEILNLKSQLKDLSLKNTQLKAENLESKALHQRLKEEQFENKYDRIVEQDLVEEYSWDALKIKILTPNIGMVSLKYLQRMKQPEVVTIYQEFYYLFKNYLLHEGENKYKQLNIEKLKDLTLNFGNFVTYLRYQNGLAYQYLTDYNFETQHHAKRSIEETIDLYKYCEKVLNLSEEQYYKTYLVEKNRFDFIDYQKEQCQKYINKLCQAYIHKDAQEYHQGYSVIINPNLMIAIIDFYKLYTTLFETTLRQVKNFINQLLEPDMIAQLVVSAYPKVPCFREFGVHIMESYINKNQDINKHSSPKFQQYTFKNDQIKTIMKYEMGKDQMG